MCRASLVFTIRGRVRVLGLGFCVRLGLGLALRVVMSHTTHFDAESRRRKSAPISGVCVIGFSYLNENCSLHTLLLSAPAIHRQIALSYRQIVPHKVNKHLHLRSRDSRLNLTQFNGTLWT